MPTHMTSHPSVLAGKVQSFGLKNPDPYYYLVVFYLTVITELAGSKVSDMNTLVDSL